MELGIMEPHHQGMSVMSDSKYQMGSTQYRQINVEAAKELIATLTEAVKLVEESNHPEGFAYTDKVMVLDAPNENVHYQKYRVSKDLHL